MNVLLKPFDTEYNTAPFSKISDEDFLPAFKEAIEMARKEINDITENIAAPTFRNTIEALDFAGHQLERISSIFFNLNSAETNDKIQKIAQEVSPLLSEFGNDITLNEVLFARVKSVYDQRGTLHLNAEQSTLLSKKYKSFSRNGANLEEDQKQKLREIDKKLSQLKLKFGENVLAETNAFQMHLIDEEDLAGLPEGEMEAAKQLAESKNLEGWLVTLHHPSYIPFMTYANNRELRKKLAIAAGKKAFQDNEFNNEENVLEIARLRHERANLLGYKTHAHFVLEERMAKTPESVTTFLNNLKERAKPAAEREFKKLQSFAIELDGIEDFQKWDSA